MYASACAYCKCLRAAAWCEQCFALYLEDHLIVKLSAQWRGNFEVTEALKDGAISARVIFIISVT